MEDIDLNYHIDESVQEAFDYTRSDKIWNNLKRKGKLNINKTYNIKLKATYEHKIKKYNDLCYITKQ